MSVAFIMHRGPGFSKMFLLSSLLTPIKQTPNLNLKKKKIEEFKNFNSPEFLRFFFFLSLHM
jgi:hypothetical protein